MIRLKRSLGILRSLLIYHIIPRFVLPWRKRKMKRLYSAFLKAGDLAFDIGAHVGSRTAVFRSLAARCIALEPQPACVRVLKRLYGNDAGVTIVEKAAGASSGKAALHISNTSPTLSTLSMEWKNRVSAVSIFKRVRWEAETEVDVITLDELIERWGMPQFCKIDVEGYEGAVLKGLSQPLPALSFEVLPASIETAFDCLEVLETLGTYKYNIAFVERMEFHFPVWVDGTAVTDYIRNFPRNGRSGDIYAQRQAES